MNALTYTHRVVLPAAYRLLPPQMATPEATAMLLAIGLQESRFAHRRQMGGPARGFWQFERDGGVAGVISHHKTRPVIGQVLGDLSYPVFAEDCYRAIEHNDILAACFARLLLLTVPMRLPRKDDADLGWASYIAGWRPGKPHRQTWDAFFALAWDVVQP